VSDVQSLLSLSFQSSRSVATRCRDRVTSSPSTPNSWRSTKKNRS